MTGTGRRSGPAASGAVPRLYERAHAIIAAEVLSGTLGEGEAISETSLARRFGISRAPARQALEELERDGFARKADGRGYRIIRPPAGSKTSERHSAPTLDDGRLVPTPTWERIYSEVESEIVARTAFGSWRVIEADLARYYDVSRTVARDVLGRLEKAGIVRRDERTRWHAPALSRRNVSELYEMRWVLEPVALASAIPHVPQDYLSAMQRHLETAIGNAAQQTGSHLDALEEELHVRLLGYCGNATMMRAIRLHQSLLIAHRFLYRWTSEMFRLEPFLPEHLAIVERIRSGRVSEAQFLLEQHLKGSRERALARVELIAHRITPDSLAYLQAASE